MNGLGVLGDAVRVQGASGVLELDTAVLNAAVPVAEEVLGAGTLEPAVGVDDRVVAAVVLSGGALVDVDALEPVAVVSGAVAE